MKHQPLVSIICICHNQAAYVREAVASVMTQTYKNIEIFLCDDASSDQSVAEIASISAEYPSIKVILNEKQTGNCTLFNQAYRQSSGEYLIDLAADDVLLPERVEKGVTWFESQTEIMGVNYCGWQAINMKGEKIKTAKSDKEGLSGDIYRNLIQYYFVNPATMMFRRSVIDHLEGYDENLKFEDFDFWIRSARKFHYGYINETLVWKRKVTGSLSSRQIRFFNPYQQTTLAVCQKALHLNHDKNEDNALAQRSMYEIRQAIKTLNVASLLGFVALWLKIKFKRNN